jgi:hypothetical protein
VVDRRASIASIAPLEIAKLRDAVRAEGRVCRPRARQAGDEDVLALTHPVSSVVPTMTTRPDASSSLPRMQKPSGNEFSVTTRWSRSEGLRTGARELGRERHVIGPVVANTSYGDRAVAVYGKFTSGVTLVIAVTM